MIKKIAKWYTDFNVCKEINIFKINIKHEVLLDPFFGEGEYLIAFDLLQIINMYNTI